MLLQVPDLSEQAGGREDIFNGNAAYVPIDTLNKMPDLVFILDNNLTISLNATEYTAQQINSSQQRLSALRLKGTETPTFVFGQTILSKVREISIMVGSGPFNELLFSSSCCIDSPLPALLRV